MGDLIENFMINDEEKMKLAKLREYISSLGTLAVGFSGGVDSSLLVTVAKEVLSDGVLAVTGEDASIPKMEIEFTKEFCRERGIRYRLIKVDPLSIKEFKENAPDRCYFCKRGIFSEIIKTAKEEGIKYVAEGSNMDDLGDYRPGLKAVSELKVVSPLREAELTKKEIRDISRYLGLPTWNKPAYACLASRFVYGEEITEEKLSMLDEAEEFLIGHGFLSERVRIHGKLARIEVPGEDIAKIAASPMREMIYEKFKEIGFKFVSLDLGGYRTGSMNITIEK